jgi:hypothetical protein
VEFKVTPGTNNTKTKQKNTCQPVKTNLKKSQTARIFLFELEISPKSDLELRPKNVNDINNYCDDSVLAIGLTVRIFL